MKQPEFVVRVNCMTFNQAPFILDTLNGFCIQKTSFPFLCTIFDDNSSDGEPDIIRQYMLDHFDFEDGSIAKNDETEDYVLSFAQNKNNKNCFFAVYYLKYNHFKKGKGNQHKKGYSNRIVDTFLYEANCEGDDYWIDPYKLQKQVDILEANPDFTMVCNRTRLLSVRRKGFIGENYCYNKSRVVNPKDVIYRTGLFISTCSMLYRKSITDNIPDYWTKCKVGDYPLQIMCAMKGKIYYFNDMMTVYRVENPKSWMGQQNWGKLDFDRLEVIESQINMFKGFGRDFPQYKKFFNRKIANHINRFIPANRPPQEVNQYLEYFREDIKNYNLIQKYDLWMCKLSSPRIRFLHKMLFHHIFSEHRLYYGKKSLPLWLLDKIKSKLY